MGSGSVAAPTARDPPPGTTRYGPPSRATAPSDSGGYSGRMELWNEARDGIALGYLRDLEAAGGGYLRRGVRGWALTADVERETGCHLPERLPLLHGRGLLTREDVRLPGRARPVWIYRISEAGACLVAEWEGSVPRTLQPSSPPGEGEREAAVYVPSGSLLALEALRLMMRDTTPSPLLPGERGWRTAAELEALVRPRPRRPPGWLFDMQTGDPDEWDDPPPWRDDERREPVVMQTVFTEDLNWLVRAGLAQRFGVPPVGRGRPTVLYRVTPAGAAVIPLDWRDPEG